MDLESRYELLEKIGTGSFATVYRARDRELGREVAIKQIHEQYLHDPEQLDRYWQEAQLLASLQHPNIATIFDIYRDRGWLILELMQGSLAERLAGRQMSLPALRTTLAHSLRALKYLHARGIVHGDIKPANMMIDARKRVKLGDFGLARRVSDDEGSLLKGATKYMAPEVVSDEFGDVGPASDLYSLGFVAYELMCGENFESLFPGLSAFGRNRQVAWMMWHAARDRRLPPIHRVLEGVPEDLARAVERLVEKDQSKRYRSADEALADLKVELKPARSDAGTAEMEDDEPSEDPARRKRLLLLGGAFAFSLVMSLMILFLPGGGSRGDTEAEASVWVVSEVFADQNALKVEHPERAEAQELAVGESPRILLKGKNQSLLLREVLPGDRIEVRDQHERGGRTVKVITVSRPVVSRGRLQRVERRDGRIVVSVDEGDTRETLRLRIGERAPLDVNARPATLYDLEEGDRVEVLHLDEFGGRTGRVAVRLSVRRVEEKVGFVAEKYPSREPPRLEVRFGRGSPESPLNLPLAPDCRIVERDGSELRLEDLQFHDRVRFRHDTQFHEVVVTRGKRAAGVALQIGPQDGDLLLRTDDGAEIAFEVGPECEITLGMAPAELDDLRDSSDSLEITWNEGADGGPVAVAIFATRGVVRTRAALVIGVERYADRNLALLERTVADARLVHDTLRHRYGVPEDSLRLLIDPTKKSLQDQVVEFLAGTGSRTQVIVYVAAHSYVGDDGRAYLAGRDFRLDQADRTGLPLDWLVEQLENCPSQDKLLLFDGSHSGSGRDLDRQPSAEELLRKLTVRLESTHAIAASSAGERGRDWIPGRRGAFAHFVAEAFGGQADRDRDLHISAHELFRYLSAAMPAASLPGGTQTPVLLGR